MWYSIASILSVFDIGPEIGADGKPILPSMEYASGVLRSVKSSAMLNLKLTHIAN